MGTFGDVRIGPVQIHAMKVSEGFELHPDGVDGWDSGSEIRRDEVARAIAHGSFDAPGFQTARVVIIPGRCVAPSLEKLGWYRSQLIGLLADGGSARVMVDEYGETQWATARLGARTRWKSFGGAGYADFQLTLWCPDPRKFGSARTFGPASSVSAHHFGNFPAAPVLTVEGTVSGYTINGPDGKGFVVTAALTSGHPHVIDMATGRLSIDGVVQVGAVSRAETWTVPPGQQVTMSVTAGTLTAEVLDTYI